MVAEDIFEGKIGEDVDEIGHFTDKTDKENNEEYKMNGRSQDKSGGKDEAVEDNLELDFGEKDKFINKKKESIDYANKEISEEQESEYENSKHENFRESIADSYPEVLSILDNIKRLNKMDYLPLTDYILTNSPIFEIYENNNGALKNVYHFFELMRKYSSLSEFIDYLRENKDSDQLKQVGARGENAVQLMTIHQAKGLDFETEFFYWKPSSGGNYYNQLKFYIDFDDNYEEVEDYLLTNTRYKKLFSYLDINFPDREESKSLMEEINNIYVALTRPEKNLFLYIETPRKLKISGNKRSWTGSDQYGFYEPAIVKGFEVDSLKELVTGKSYGDLKLEADESESEVDGEKKEKEDIQKNTAEMKTEKTLPHLHHYFKADHISEKKLDRVTDKKNAEMNLEMEIKRIKGLAHHHYLQYVKFNTQAEREYARSMVLSRYGNILGPERMNNLLHRIDNFIENNPDYFDEKWEIFTEYEVNKDEESFRIDRLMVNEKGKRILIVDYKTGTEHEQLQLDDYEEVVEELSGGEYVIESEFVEV